MKTGSFTIWGYWPNREEDAAACAVRLARMLEQLAATSTAFAEWYKKGMSLRASYKPFCAMPPQPDELTLIMRRGQHWKDVPREPWPELGYNVFAWNGMNDERGVSFNVQAGAYGSRRLFPNIVTVEVGSYASRNADVINAETLKAALIAVIGSWDISWGCVCSGLYTERIHAGKSFAPGDPAPPPFRAGWMTYLSAPLAGKIVPPVEAIGEPIPNGGLLMRATDEVFTIENPRHLAAADAIQQALEPLQFDQRAIDGVTAQRRLGL